MTTTQVLTENENELVLLVRISKDSKPSENLRKAFEFSKSSELPTQRPSEALQTLFFPVSDTSTTADKESANKCIVCGVFTKKKVKEFSLRKFGKNLCMLHQQ